jgi:dTDP-glucose 4,6-dehydratase
LKTVIVTGGAGFIGSAVVRQLIFHSDYRVVNFDKLTHAGNLESLELVAEHPRYHFERGDICDHRLVKNALIEFEPCAVMHLADESNIDRSVVGPAEFINTNIVGTSVLLEEARWYCKEHKQDGDFRFHHVSTGEVYGPPGETAMVDEHSPYKPGSPYAASKAASDLLVRAWGTAYGLPVVISNCSDNYGPYQHPHELVPRAILNALDGKALSVPGDGEQIRDWLYVEDHARALCLVMEQGKAGETYNIGAGNEMRNIDVVKSLCRMLDEEGADLPEGIDSFEDLIESVDDRADSEKRYAIDAGKIRSELDWRPRETFASGLEKTIDWYRNNREWCNRILDDR